MSNIICAHCGRNSDLGHFDYKSKGGGTLGLVFLCDVCKSLIKNINIQLTLDDDKVQAIKEAMELSKKSGEEKTQDESEENA